MSLYFGSSQVYEVYLGDAPVNQIYYKNQLFWARRITLTIVPNPSDATVVLTAAGETQSGNSITVYYGKTVSCTVSKYGYVTKTENITPTDNESYPISLVNQYTFTITPDPSDATVTLTANPGSTQVGNSILVDPGGTVSWSVSKSAGRVSSG